MGAPTTQKPPNRGPGAESILKLDGSYALRKTGRTRALLKRDYCLVVHQAMGFTGIP